MLVSTATEVSKDSTDNTDKVPEKYAALSQKEKKKITKCKDTIGERAM